MKTVLRHLASSVPAIVAASIALAPVAGATSNPVGCRDSGAATVCQKQGHVSLQATPTVRTPSGTLGSSPWLPGYGRGMLPPLLALD